jgi:hypothetical protein
MIKILTIQQALEEFEFFPFYSNIIETYGEHLEDPSLVSDFYDLIDEHEEEYEFQPDEDGDYTESFERNLIEALHNIVEENENLEFSDDGFPTDIDFSEIAVEHFKKDSEDFEVDLEEDEEIDD